jgi:antirestriction protein ArdC
MHHELIHSIGHSRLSRKSILKPSYFGSHEYSKEGLVAEMGAVFLCGHSGIEHRIPDNSAAYSSGPERGKEKSNRRNKLKEGIFTTLP